MGNQRFAPPGPNGQQGPPAQSVADLPEEVQTIFFTKDGTQWACNPSVREFIQLMTEFMQGTADALFLPAGSGEMVFSRTYLTENYWMLAWTRPRPERVNAVTDPSVVRAVTGRPPR